METETDNFLMVNITYKCWHIGCALVHVYRINRGTSITKKHLCFLDNGSLYNQGSHCVLHSVHACLRRKGSFRFTD